MRSLRLGVLVSGGGTTLQNFLDRERAGSLAGEVVQVVSSDPDAKAVARARKAGKPVCSVAWDREKGADAFARGITKALDGAKVDLVLLAGFLRLYRFPQSYAGRVLNIHPALLPAFGGKGMYGMRVHEAVAASGAKVTGCTVHFADLVYDRGPIVLQRTCPVEFRDTPAEIAARVFELEKEAYPEAVALYAAGRLRVRDGRVEVLG
ncbi:MAG TPA: phosphoribosylglycinamide formyltransferase [Planctomycetota bacterium]|nr:phosphoribosylglycinamide formyltransferase [Planctomycetota bacterium]